jgi:hypothetical protein
MECLRWSRPSVYLQINFKVTIIKAVGNSEDWAVLDRMAEDRLVQVSNHLELASKTLKHANYLMISLSANVFDFRIVYISSLYYDLWLHRTWSVLLDQDLRVLNLRRRRILRLVVLRILSDRLSVNVDLESLRNKAEDWWVLSRVRKSYFLCYVFSLKFRGC